ncbi:MAG: sigma-54 dependent transcriptional regulator [bacterium]
MAKILIVDDEPSIRTAVSLAFEADGHETFEAESKETAFEFINLHKFDLVISDLYIPIESHGIDILKYCKQQIPDTFVIIITAHSSIEKAVELIKAGADDFVAKGFKMEELKFRVSRFLKQKQLKKENEKLVDDYNRLRKEVEGKYNFKQIIGNSKPMQNLMQLLERVIDDNDSTVLLQGESGTGKELVARALHYNGARKDKPFVTVNCAALPDHLLESELFGFEKGAFTGALQNKPGKFEIANGGTIFIDEIGEISAKVQVELLRFLQDHTFERIGNNSPITVDVRIVAATNKNLREEVSKGNFREDLFYRLNVIPVNIPPLRNRREDIPILINHFIEKLKSTKGRELKISPEAIAKMEEYNWPGNIRELENLIQRLTVTTPSSNILLSDLPSQLLGNFEKGAIEQAMKQTSLKEACDDFEKTYLQHYLEKYRWNISETAQALDEHRDTLSKKIKRYGLDKPE